MTLRLSSDCQFRTKFLNYLQYKVAQFYSLCNDLVIMKNMKLKRQQIFFLLLHSLR